MSLPLFVEQHPRLPRAPRKSSAQATQALGLYDRIQERPAYPVQDRRREILRSRLDRLLQSMEISELASYYAGLQARREAAQ